MSLTVEVTLKGPLSRYSQGEDSTDMQLLEGAAVADVLKRLSLPREKTSLLVVNGVKAGVDTPLMEGDRGTLYPPVSGG